MEMAKILFASQSGGSKSPLMIKNLTLEVLVRFKTNTKLNLEINDVKTRKLIYQGNLEDSEYHFVKFEGKLPPLEMSIHALKSIALNFELSDWTITDFDNCLEGNPHV
jgi:hypothetical protein